MSSCMTAMQDCVLSKQLTQEHLLQNIRLASRMLHLHRSYLLYSRTAHSLPHSLT